MELSRISLICVREIEVRLWGREGWKKVVVCIVSDGRGKINSRTLSVIAAMGAYKEGVAKVSERVMWNMTIYSYLMFV